MTLPRERGVYYAFTYVESATERDDELVAAFADSMTAWVNGKER